MKPRLSFRPVAEKTAGRLVESFTFSSAARWRLEDVLLRKEVIQPLVPQRLPCYDFIPITTHTLGGQMPDFGCRRLS